MFGKILCTLLSLSAFVPALSAQSTLSPFSTTRNGEVRYSDWYYQGGLNAAGKEVVMVMASGANGDVLINDDFTGVELRDDEGNILRSYDDFVSAYDACFLSGGGFMITDSGSNEVRLYNAAGQQVSTFGSAGSGNGQFSSPKGIYAAGTGLVYVVDSGNRRVQVFNSSGNYQSQFSTASVQQSPSGICQVDNTLWITDDERGSIDVYSLEGNFVHSMEVSRSETTTSAGMTVYINHMPVDLEPGPFDTVHVTYADLGNLTDRNNNLSEIYSTKTLVDEAGNRGLSSLGTAYFGSLLVDEETMYRVVEEYDFGGVAVYRQRIVFPESSPFPAGDNAVPVPQLISVSQRPGTDLFDIAFEVIDDSDSVEVGFLVRTDEDFEYGVNEIGMLSLVEGTDAYVGKPISPNTTYTVTWDAQEDLGDIETDFFIEMLCKDDRGIETIHYIDLPVGEGGADVSFVQSVDNYEALYKWWMAIGDGDISQSLGSYIALDPNSEYTGDILSYWSSPVYGGGSGYWRNEAFIFWKLGIRESTTDERAAAEALDEGVSNDYVIEL